LAKIELKTKMEAAVNQARAKNQQQVTGYQAPPFLVQMAFSDDHD